MENQPLQPTSPTPPSPIPLSQKLRSHRGLVIGAVLALVVIVALVVLLPKKRTPLENLQLLEKVSDPVTQTPAERLEKLSLYAQDPRGTKATTSDTQKDANSDTLQALDEMSTKQ